MAFNGDAAAERLKNFEVHSPIYKTLKNISLTVDIIVPKKYFAGKRPIIVRFHGGYLVTGSSLFLGAFAPWIFDYAQKTNAVIVSPNYQKLPEAKGVDLLADVDDFWLWVQRHLETEVDSWKKGVLGIDLTKILVIGQSAGGYLAALSAFRPVSSSKIRAVVLAYPMLDMRSPWFAESFEKHPFGFPMQPATTLSDHLATVKSNTTMGAVDPPERMQLALAIVQYGQFPKLLGSDSELYPLELLAQFRRFPPCFIYHGLEDSAVSVDGTRKWADLLKKVVPDAKLAMKLEHGDHGDKSFEVAPNLEEGWLREGLDLLQPAWLAG